MKAILLIVLSLIFVTPSFAARVLAVKGRKLLIDSQGDRLRKGEVFYVVSKKGKKRGILKILKIKGRKAIAVMSKKSRARKGWRLKKKKRRKGRRSVLKDTSRLKYKSYWGAVGGLSMSSLEATGNSNGATLTDISASGSGFSAKGLYDYALFEKLWFRALVGLEQLNVSAGESTCRSSSTEGFTSPCKINIMYASADLWGRFLFSKNKFKPWVGGGFSLLFPMSKDVAGILEETISNTNLFSVGGGINWPLNRKMSVPIQVEYNIYPPTNTVEANSITIRAGIRFPLK